MATVVSFQPKLQYQSDQEEIKQENQRYSVDNTRSTHQSRDEQTGTKTLKVQEPKDDFQYKSQLQYEYESQTPQQPTQPRSRPHQQPPVHLNPAYSLPPHSTQLGRDHSEGQEETPTQSFSTGLKHSTITPPPAAFTTSTTAGNDGPTKHLIDNQDPSQDLSSRLSYLALSLPSVPTHPGNTIDQYASVRAIQTEVDNINGGSVHGLNVTGSRGRRGRSSSVSLVTGGARWRSPYHHHHVQSTVPNLYTGSPVVEGGPGVDPTARKQGRRRSRARSQLCAAPELNAIFLGPTEFEKDDEKDHLEFDGEKSRLGGRGEIDHSSPNNSTQPRTSQESQRGRTRTSVTILEVVPDSPPVLLEEGGFEVSGSGSEWSGTTSEAEVDASENGEESSLKWDEPTMLSGLSDDVVSPRNSSITPGKKEKRVRMGSRVRFEHLHHHTPSPHSLVHSHNNHNTYASPPTREKTFDPYTATIPTLTHLLQSSQITSAQIIETYLSQINHHNPTLRALTWVREREDVMREARVCDLYRSRGWVDWERKPLWGVPIVVKDNIATDEQLGMPTTAGSYALLGMPVKKDAFIVRKLREAGAIILAKANMSELADYKSAHAGAGWSAVGGQTINVYAAHASPGTSSSGNGVSVAAGFCPASIGTETDGSITLPCLQSCLYGLKPTVGMLSRAGVVPFAPYFDTPGPMAKDVKSLAILMDVMSARDEEDVKTLEVDRIPRGVKYVDSCNAPSFEGLRIGIPRANWHNIDPWRRPGRDELVPEIANPFEQFIEMMVINGAVVQDPADIPSAVDGSLWECLSGSRSLVVAADCNHYLGKYLQNLGGSGGCRSVADIIEFNEEHADIEMPPGHHGQEVLRRCLDAVSVESDEYACAKADMKLIAGKRGLDAVMDEYDLDALFMIREGHHSAANMVGYPIAAVPIGTLSDNTPYGAFFIGRKHGEQTLLRIMAAWEATFAARPLPPIATEA